MPSILHTILVSVGVSLCVIGGMFLLGGEYAESQQKTLQSKIIHETIKFLPAMLNLTGSQYNYILNNADYSTLVYFDGILVSFMDNIRRLQSGMNGVDLATCNLYEPQEFKDNCRNFLLLMRETEKSFVFALSETQRKLNEFTKSKAKNTIHDLTVENSTSKHSQELQWGTRTGKNVSVTQSRI